MNEENVKRSNLTGLEKMYIIMKYAFADKILSARDARLIPSIRVVMREGLSDELLELAREEQRAKAKGYENYLSLPEILFLLRELHSLEERKLFAFFFLVHRRSVNYIKKVNFRQYAIENAPKLSDEDLQIAGLSKEDVEKIIAMYSETNGEVENNGKRN